MAVVNPSKCELCEISRKKVPPDGMPVAGQGNPKADIMFIGEAPGENEAKEDAVFIGKAGQELDKMLELAGLKREDIYITNVCKCRPYKLEQDNRGVTKVWNRAPDKIEIKNCSRFLKQELDIIQPKILVTLGGVALAALEGRVSTKINERKGIPAMYKKTNIFIMPTLHPSYIARNGGVTNINNEITPLAQEVVSHLKEAKAIASGKIEAPKKRYMLVNSQAKLKKLIAEVQRRRVMSFDIEATGLGIDDEILGIGIAIDVGVAAYIPFLEKGLFGSDLEDFWADKDLTKEEVIAHIKPLFEDKTIRTSAHNAKFDMRQMQKKMGIKVNNLFWDTMCGSYLINENGRHGLKSLKNRYIDLLGYEDDWNESTKKGTESANAPMDIIVMYCCGDCDATYRETKRQFELFKQHPNLMKLMKQFYIPLMYLIKDIEYEGVLYNVAKAEPASQELAVRAKELQEQIWDSVPNREAGEFNIDSNDEVSKVLYGVLGLQIDENNKKMFYTDKRNAKTGKKNVKVDKDVLEYLGNQHAMPKLIIEYRHVGKMKSTYIDNMLAELDSNNRAHKSYNPIGTVTGRPSCKGLMNIPREKYIKRLFWAPKGSKLIQVDLSQAEVRCFAHYANEEVLRNAFAVEGVDVHCLVAAEVNGFNVQDFTQKYLDGDPVCAKLRQAAKGTVFGLLYGRGALSIAAEYGLSLEEAEAFMNNFFKRFPNCKKWIDDTHKMVQDVGYVQNIFGRIRRLPAIYASDNAIKERAKRQSVNSIIQSTASDITLLAMIKIHQHIKKENLPAKIVLTVYDSIIAETRDDHVDYVSKIMADALERKPTTNFTIKMRADVDVYQEWGIDCEWKGAA